MLAVIASFLLAHWIFFAATAMFATVGQVAKKLVSPESAAQSRWAYAFRVTMPLHPVLAGLAIGALNLIPASTGVGTPAEKAMYFGVAGVLSSYFFDLVQRLGPDLLALVKRVLRLEVEK